MLFESIKNSRVKAAGEIVADEGDLVLAGYAWSGKNV